MGKQDVEQIEKALSQMTFEQMCYRERKSHPERIYHPRTLQEVKKAIESGYFVIDNSIEVKVKDDWHEFSHGSLPCQKVVITFDYIRLTKEKEIPFDRELIKNGY